MNSAAESAGGSGEHRSEADALTGLANRALLEERLDAAAVLAERGTGFAVLCMDLDRFKAVNDTYRHPVGDSVLRAMADRLRAEVRETETLARLGGDVVEATSQTFELDGYQLHVGTSVGIALARTDNANPVQLMKDADRTR